MIKFVLIVFVIIIVFSSCVTGNIAYSYKINNGKPNYYSKENEVWGREIQYSHRIVDKYIYRVYDGIPYYARDRLLNYKFIH
jgi:uncharacterized protein YxeA